MVEIPLTVFHVYIVSDYFIISYKTVMHFLLVERHLCILSYLLLTVNLNYMNHRIIEFKDVYISDNAIS